MGDEGQKYVIDIGLRSSGDLTSVVCQKGADEIFADIIKEKEFILFYCCEGDKTLVRVSDICSIYSKKQVQEHIHGSLER